jgi:uncharacterized Fe-S cluster-containing MiaB family protein
MKRGFKKNQIILVTAISLALLVTSAYFCYYTVAAADFLSPNLNFETFDQEFLSSADESELKVFLPGSFLNGFQLMTYLFEQSPHFFSKILSLGQETLILRC